MPTGFHVLIPARLQSTRLPNKPLADICGLPMVVRVAQRAATSQALSVTVATDSQEIVQACQQHNIHVVLTDVNHASGSDRLAQASRLLGLEQDAIVVNVQGDEPLIEPELISACATALQNNADCAMSTAAHPLSGNIDYANPNVVKVVCDTNGRALYFSRAPIPWWRDGNLNAQTNDKPQMPEPEELQKASAFLHHIGIYAYRVGFLQRFPTLPPAPLEKLESLEQLRVLWHGERIAVHVSNKAPNAGVDTPEDLERVREIFASQPN